ncbi:hypothetical protein C162_22495 [Paenibacillus sp. FSL R7-269]|nr:hypothetical protein C162_22495 [Paenibacillus sp. FSL R7-269]
MGGPYLNWVRAFFDLDKDQMYVENSIQSALLGHVGCVAAGRVRQKYKYHLYKGAHQPFLLA